MNKTQTNLRVLSTSTLERTNVVNTKGESLGTIEEIMLDLDSGRIAYVVVAFGGFLGMGDKLFAFPWDMMRVDTDHERVVMNVDKQKLENAPGFDKNNWPTAPTHEWLNEIHTYYGAQSYNR